MSTAPPVALSPLVDANTDGSSVAKPFINARPPFDDLGADIILRSSSGVDFYLSRPILSFASPFFDTMFSLPLPQAGAVQEMKDGKPVISVEEDEDTLDLLLKYCYPRWCTTLELEKTSFEKLISARQAAEKYEMEGVENRIREELIAERFLAKDPLRMYAIALRYRLERETRVAAKATLRLPILGRQYFDELEYISAGAHHRLQVYHLKCAEVAKKVATNLDWMTADKYVWFECNGECRNQASYTINYTPEVVTISGNRRKWVLSRWWWEYMTQAGRALAERPLGATVTDPDLMDDALGKASGCGFCRGRAFKEMRAFANVFSDEVDKAIAEVGQVPLMSTTILIAQS
ncbi:hypothetical protein D9615_007393 [Tricholomella constricta]|uniref:BTB domain-containing protein n=1 Tax=Tricholomella constricta TaxID=117010 RepID=A0A8H5GYG4_9AGAR|nr:hypothetical protein D9615_007393 [Tricholomella constricta]